MDWLAEQWAALLQLALSNSAPLVVDVLLTALLVYPLWNFLSYGWVRKQEEIEASLTRKAKRAYFEVFWERDDLNDDGSADAEFAKQYQKWYGRHRYVPALIFVLLVAAIENFILGKALVDVTTSVAKPGGDPGLSTAAAAIAGAYTFVAWDFFGRVQRRSVSTSDILRSGLRLATAVPIGITFASLASTSVAPFMAFGVGVFPLQDIKALVRRLVNKQLNQDKEENIAPDLLTRLSGIDHDIADRVSDVDITTVPQLAWCDPIQLTMRSSLQFDFVIDIVSQALAWSYLGEKLITLRNYGLRGAFEIRVLMDDLKSADDDERARAAKVPPIAAKAVDMDVGGLMYAFDQIARDRATLFLYEASKPVPDVLDNEPEGAGLPDPPRQASREPAPAAT